MNPFDWWGLALVPGLAALGWSVKNALRLRAIERELWGLDDDGTPEDPVGWRDAPARDTADAREGRPC